MLGESQNTRSDSALPANPTTLKSSVSHLQQWRIWDMFNEEIVGDRVYSTVCDLQEIEHLRSLSFPV